MRIAKWMMLSVVLVSTVASAAPRRKSKRQKSQPDDAPIIELGSEEAPTKKKRDKREQPEPVAAIEEPAPVEESEESVEEDEQPVEEVAIRKKSKKRSRVGNEFYFRAGIAHVDARIKSGGLQLEPVGIVKLAAPMGPTNGEIVTDPTNIFAAIIGFAPGFAGGYLAVETIIGIPKKAKLRAKGDLANKSLAPTALDLVPTGIPPLGEELAEASAVPPMVTLVARSPKLGPVRIYAGAGVSVLFVTDAKVTNKVLTEVATPRIEVDPTVGFVAQAGIDVQIYSRFYARLDFKELWFQPTETRISNIHVKTTIPLLETVEVGSGRSTSTANPIIVQLGIGASF